MTQRKTTPHLKRGPKPKPKPPKRARGHPHLPLHLHPHRHKIATQEAMTWLLESGWTASVALIDMATKHLPLPDAEFVRAADRLRFLARPYRTDAADGAWLHAARDAIVTVMGTVIRPDLADIAEQKVLSLAASINETDWARRQLLPLIEETREAPRGRADKK
jgi:hypothetical protein